MKKQLLLALLLVAGLAAVFAFKQEHTPKKYQTLTFNPDNGWITVVDEQGAKEILKINGKLTPGKSEEWIEGYQSPLTAKLNELAAKGYKLVAVSPTIGGSLVHYTTYVFEKE